MAMNRHFVFESEGVAVAEAGLQCNSADEARPLRSNAPALPIYTRVDQVHMHLA